MKFLYVSIGKKYVACPRALSSTNVAKLSRWLLRLGIWRFSKYALVDFDFWCSKFELTRDEAGRKKFFDLFYALIDKIPEWDRTARKRCYIELATSGQFKIPKQHLDWFVAELQKLLMGREDLAL